MKHTMALMVLASAVAACAGTAAPAERMASAQAAIRSAGEVGAERNPNAALYLQYAREEFSQAEDLSRRGEGERAERVLLRAQADAELAMALSRQVTSQNSAQQAVAQQRAMQSQTP